VGWDLKSLLHYCSRTSDLLKQCGSAQPAEAPRARLTLIPIRWLNPSLETNDELANSAVFARIVPALAIILLEPKRSYFEPIPLVLCALRNQVVVE
jgi:hypothetical protein